MRNTSDINLIILTHKTDLNAFINKHSPHLAHEKLMSKRLSLKDLSQMLTQFNPNRYVKTRNFLNGDVSHLSPFISRGLISLSEIFDLTINKDNVYSLEKWVNELMWRVYFRHVFLRNPEYFSQSAHAYQTGFEEDDYAKTMPLDILGAKTPNAAINEMIEELIHSAYLHNHSRMYLASYIVHFRKIHWKVGADWMGHFLLDYDEASNHGSWQWVASTFSSKPYIFNLENLQKYAKAVYTVSERDNPELNESYEALQQKLFKGKQK